MPTNMEEVTQNNKFNIVDILLLDHKYLKECTIILKDEAADKKLKLRAAKCFLDAVYKHSFAERKSVYAPLLKVEDLRRDILEGEIEHGIVDNKVKMLSAKLTGLRSLSEELEIELKVLSELLDNHLADEEKKILTKMQMDLDRTILNEMGFQFMKLRNFSEKDLRFYPKLQKEVSVLKKLGHKVSGSFIARVQKHVLPHGHQTP